MLRKTRELVSCQDSSRLLRHLRRRRQYAKVVGGLLYQPPPPPPVPQSSHKPTETSDKSPSWQSLVSTGKFREPSNNARKEIHVDISRPPPQEGSSITDFWTVLTPPKMTPSQVLHKHLIDTVRYREDLQSSPSLHTLMEDLNGKVNAEIPQVLKNGNLGSPAYSLNEIADSVVTIAHILPRSPSSPEGEVILCSGFAILDGAHISTCTHPFHQINAHCRAQEGGYDKSKQSTGRTIVITKSGEIVPIIGIESHLTMSDVVILRIPSDWALAPLQVNPYPSPAGNPIQVYNLHDTQLNSETRPIPKWSWQDSEITLYQDRAGREAATGTYDELNTLLFDTVPLPGSSGGPIIDRETKAVIGITRGSEISYAVRKERGFGTPAETLFNVFKLDM